MKIKVSKHKKPIVKPSFYEFNPLSWDSLWAYHPCVVENKGKYYLFYTGRSLGRGISHSIGVAVSSDLKNWQKLPQSPVLTAGKKGEWDNYFTAHAFVFKEKDRFYMLYDGSRKEHWLEEIGLAESRDLIHWQKHEKNPVFKVEKNWWEKRHVSRCCLFKKGDVYYLYYAGHDGERERIGLAKGKNLFNLKRIAKEPILDLGKKSEWDAKSISDPQVLKYRRLYLMFYSGIDQNGIERMGVALSDDLLSWQKYRHNPILDVSQNGWDRISASRAEAKIINDQVFLFYSGRKKFFYKIGIAKLKITL